MLAAAFLGLRSWGTVLSFNAIVHGVMLWPKLLLWLHQSRLPKALRHYTRKCKREVLRGAASTLTLTYILLGGFEPLESLEN